MTDARLETWEIACMRKRWEDEKAGTMEIPPKQLNDASGREMAGVESSARNTIRRDNARADLAARGVAAARESGTTRN